MAATKMYSLHFINRINKTKYNMMLKQLMELLLNSH